MKMRVNMLSRYGLPLIGLCILVGLVGGCDSFMNPSQLGRFESTPVVLPILERLDIVDDAEAEIVGLSSPTPADLIPQNEDYILTSGDTLELTIYNLINQGDEVTRQRRIDQVGYIHFPLIEHVKAAGLTTQQLKDKIIDLLVPEVFREREDAVVSVNLLDGQQRQFTIFGVPNSGPWRITKNNYRLTDAVAIGGGVAPNVRTIYVIRQVALADEVFRGETTAPDRMEGPGGTGNTPPPRMKDPASVLENLTEGLEDVPEVPELEAPKPQPEPGPAPEPGRALDGALDPGEKPNSRFIYIDGKFVEVKDPTMAAGGTSDAQAFSELVTQRVIEIDARALMRGETQWNIAIRPNDIIRVMQPEPSIVTVKGNVNREGTYDLPGEGQITLTEIIGAAGGLNEVGIPERVEIWRRIGDNEYAIVMLNLRAIAEGVQPDIFLRPHDQINVGTNLWASFAAVIRNGFRMSYGFGFLLDRNFGADVFGPPPQNRFR